jgi:uncharacterized protein
VETDGSFEQADSLKTAYDGAPATGYDVFRHGFAELAGHPGVRARQLGIEGVSETCRGCPVVESCGGGLYAHRYSTARAFDNPSVFCQDLRALVDGIAERITQRELSSAVHDAAELTRNRLELDRTLLAVLHGSHAGRPEWDEPWRTLVLLDGDETALPELNALLDHPYVRTSVRRSLAGRPDPARAAATAAAAAVRAAADAKLSWHHDSAELHLPTVGTLRLGSPGRLEFTAAGAAFRVREADGTVHEVRPGAAGNPAGWRPPPVLDGGDGSPLLLDDADPYRDCYPWHVTPALEPTELRLFLKRWGQARERLAERVPGWRKDPAVLPATVLTPLVAGSGVRSGEHCPGAVGVAVDAEAEDFALGLLSAGRLARLAALREVTDLHVPGAAAGRLMDDASAALGKAAYWAADRPDRGALGRALARADRALAGLARRPRRELTDSGAAVVADLRAERADLRA